MNQFADDPDFNYLAIDRKKLLEDADKDYDGKTSCWIPDHKEGYIKAKITATKGEEVTVVSEKGEVSSFLHEFLCNGSSRDVSNSDKSNSTVETVRVEANLRETSTVIAQFLLQMHNKKMFDIKNAGESDEAQHPPWCNSMANIKMYKIRCTISSINFIISEILAFQIFTWKI